MQIRPRQTLLAAAIALLCLSCSGAMRQPTVTGQSPSTSAEVSPPQSTMPTTTQVTSTTSSTPTTLSSSPSSTIAAPPIEVDFALPSAQCLPDDGNLVLGADTTFWTANGDVPYRPEYWPYNAPAGSPVSVATMPARGDFDDDGIDDTVQMFSVWADNEQIGEGLRVCGSSRELDVYFIPPSNGNFGVVPIRFDKGPDGIANRPPTESVGPEVVWLFSDDGVLLPPYARTPEESNAVTPQLMECFPYEIDEVVPGPYHAVQGRTSGYALFEAITDFTVIDIATHTAGDFDGDGQDDLVQPFTFASEGTGYTYGVRLCGTSMQVEDWVHVGANKPIGFEVDPNRPATILGTSSGGQGIYTSDVTLEGQALVHNGWTLTTPE